MRNLVSRVTSDCIAKANLGTMITEIGQVTKNQLKQNLINL